MNHSHMLETAGGIVLGGVLLAWLTSPVKAEPAPSPAPGPSNPLPGLPAPLPIPGLTPAKEPYPDLVAGHWYLFTVTTSTPITDDQIAQRMTTIGTGASPILGAEVGKWWRINDQTYAFTVSPKTAVPASVLPALDNIKIQEVNSWDDGPS